jgi:erythromycin esterase-like protein
MGSSTIQFKGMTAAHAIDAAAVMGLPAARPRLLALGEPTHGEDALLEVRNDLFRRLVEREGFRAVAIESDCLMGLVVDDYVRRGEGELDDVMARGFSHGFGASSANRALVGWLRAYNESRPPAERVRFAGFDGPLEITGAASPRPALTALHAYLAERADLLPCTAETLDRLLGEDARWTNQAAMMDPSQSVGQTPDAKELRLIADDLVALLDSVTPGTSADGLERPRLYGRTATGLLRYHHWMADTSPGRMQWMLNIRASMMAANLLALVERGPVMAFGGNGHFQRDKSSMRLGDLHPHWWSAGAIVDARLGGDYAFLPMALGTIRHHDVDTPPPNTIEGLLYASPESRFVVDPRTLRELPLARRVSPWYGYAPLDPAHLANYDGIVFVKDA